MDLRPGGAAPLLVLGRPMLGYLWAWQVPELYQAALADAWIHHLEHASFSFTALLFAREPWYPAHEGGTSLWGLDLLVDQQLAGAIRGIPAGRFYTGAAVVLFLAWMRRADQVTDLREGGRSAGGLPPGNPNPWTSPPQVLEGRNHTTQRPRRRHECEIDMKYGPIRAILWAVSFLVLALAPMFLAYLGPVAPRTFWIEVGVGLGFVGLGILLLQFLLTGRYQWVATTFGLDSMLQFHRQMGLVAVGFILAHPILLFLSDPAYLEYLDPRVQIPRALALAGVTGALLLLLSTSIWRISFRLSYEWWRAVHGLLAIFVVFVGTVHVLQVGYYVSGTWKQIVFVALGAGAVILVVNTRVVRPWRMRRRPWRVEAVHEERSDASTLVLTPEDHAGMSFLPGQFAWITLGETPFTLQQHPFSFSSSAQAAPNRLAFTIKGDGDFSSEARAVQPGTSAFLEGPYGYFVPDPDPGVGCVLIAGGVGVTPFRSMLRTFADRGDPRELHLIFASVSPDQVIFFKELEELKARLHLTVVHVLEEPPEGWEGESGLINQDLLERHLPENPLEFEYFICGPEPMMNIAESALRELGIPQKRLLSERFNMV